MGNVVNAEKPQTAVPFRAGGWVFVMRAPPPAAASLAKPWLSCPPRGFIATGNILKKRGLPGHKRQKVRPVGNPGGTVGSGASQFGGKGVQEARPQKQPQNCGQGKRTSARSAVVDRRHSLVPTHSGRERYKSIVGRGAGVFSGWAPGLSGLDDFFFCARRKGTQVACRGAVSSTHPIADLGKISASKLRFR